MNRIMYKNRKETIFNDFTYIYAFSNNLAILRFSPLRKLNSNQIR